ncbi:flagellar hook-length control protein FliK [Microbacterium sp. 3J1]|uniref:flagellar hook-length control protein FliK n=1 Tax=Microbacterium sp. 3J1 TaxID=861269 RepID=UPI000A742FFB|nr:flagellar hook-length control protein FliK [Microbacterium sp. 3J1]
MNGVSMASAGPAAVADQPTAAAPSTGSAFGEALGRAEQSFDLAHGERGTAAGAQTTEAEQATGEPESSPAAGDLASSVAGVLLFGRQAATPVEGDAGSPVPTGDAPAPTGDAHEETPSAGSSASSAAPAGSPGAAVLDRSPTVVAPGPVADAAAPEHADPASRIAANAVATAGADADGDSSMSGPAAPATASAPASTTVTTATPAVSPLPSSTATATATPTAGADPQAFRIVHAGGTQTPVPVPGEGAPSREASESPAPAQAAAAPASATPTLSAPPLAQAGGASAPVPTGASDAPSPRAVAAQVAPAVINLAQRPAGTHQLTMTVNPDSLGPVTLRAHISAGGDVQVELFGGTDAGRDALRLIATDLRRDLASVMPTATLSVAHGAAGEADAGRGSAGEGSGPADQGSGREPRPDERGDRRPGERGTTVARSIQTIAGAAIGEGLDTFA